MDAELLEPATDEGGMVLLRVLNAGCTGPVMARWPARAREPAGTRVQVQGRWVPLPGALGRPDGTLLIERSTVDGLHPSTAQRLRAWLTDASAELYGTKAGTVDALVLNARGGMAPELRDQYAQSGLVHILSISGFHVGLITAWVLMLLRAAGVARVPAMLLAASVSVGYVILLGWPAPAGRAAMLAVLLALCHARQRRPQPAALLAVTCLAVMLLDPWAATDLSAWLSAGALGGATWFGRWSDRALGSHWLWRMLSSSLGATLTTAPITATAFGTVSLAGIALNFVAIPLAAVAVPGVVASLIAAALWRPLAEALAAGSGLTLRGLDLLAKWGASWPGGCVWQPAELRSALPWVMVLILVGWGMAGGTTAWEALRRWSLALAAFIWTGTFTALHQAQSDNPSDLALHFLDVGQGDGAVLRTPGGHWVVIDAGPRTDKWDAGRRTVVPFLASHRAGRIDALIVSHAHADHLGGVPALLQRFPVSLIVEPGEPVDDPLYEEFLDRTAEEGAVWRPGRPGDRFTIDGVEFRILHPDTSWTHWRDDLNEDSIVLLVEYGGFQALFAGDAGFIAESLVGSKIGAVDLLKVGHHGSRTATSDEWLERLRPAVAIVSVGKRNRYGHPNAETLARLDAHHVSVWRTDQSGTIDVTTDGRSMHVSARSRSETRDVRTGSEP
jgi:competence protein ComEC